MGTRLGDPGAPAISSLFVSRPGSTRFLLVRARIVGAAGQVRTSRRCQQSCAPSPTDVLVHGRNSPKAGDQSMTRCAISGFSACRAGRALRPRGGGVPFSGDRRKARAGCTGMGVPLVVLNRKFAELFDSAHGRPPAHFSRTPAVCSIPVKFGLFRTVQTIPSPMPPADR